MKYRRGSGQTIQLGERFGGGGEGEVFAVAGEPLVAKLYTRDPASRERKLRAMIARPPHGLLGTEPLITWPVDVVTAEHGRFVGFLMPLLRERRILAQFTNPRDRKRAFPRADQRFRYRCAENLARVFGLLHSSGYVVGDVNDRNVHVDDRAMVTLVDADSIQVTVEQDVFRCPVGTPEFTPPELFGVEMANVDRRLEHDLFGLAVLVFQLLAEGTHPFRAIPIGEGELALDAENVRAGNFAFPSDVPRFQPPRLAPRWTTFDPELRRAFLRTFRDGHRNPTRRVSAAEWADILVRVQQRLAPCTQDSSHRYWSGLDACPTCHPTAAPRLPLATRALLAAGRAGLAMIPASARLARATAHWLGRSPALTLAVAAAFAVGGSWWFALGPAWVSGATVLSGFAWLFARERSPWGFAVASATFVIGAIASIAVLASALLDDEVVARPAAPRPPIEPVAARAPESPVPATMCGASAPPRAVDAGWEGYSCRHRREVGIGWERCLGWRAYASAVELGCPGESRCCPPGPLAGAATLPAELCVDDRNPPMRVHMEPGADSPAVDELENGTRVRAERSEGEWMLLSSPVDGWAWIPWLALCPETPAAPMPAIDHSPEVRAALERRDVATAIHAYALGTSDEGLHDEIARIGANAVRGHLLMGECALAQELTRQLTTIHADATAQTLFSEEWCLAPR